MCTYGFAFVPANMLFMALGILLVILFQQQGVALPTKGDDLLPMFVESQLSAGSLIPVFFTIGIMAASFSSADSALTAMTTSFCVDIRERQGDERLRKRVHILMAVVFTVLILMVDAVNSTSVIDAIYILCSYTYGPLLGLFAYGLLTKRGVNDRWVPYIAVASPLICFALDKTVASTTGYQFGYELLMLNGLLTFLGLWLTARKW
jgi:Na+/proline symporter